MLNDILGNQTYIVKNYIDQCIALVKSMLICCHDEASLYNDRIASMLPGFVPSNKKSDWKYYKHLAGIPYHIGVASIDDIPIKLTSLDTGLEIILTRDKMNSSPMTRKALLKFDYYLNDLYSRYPGYNIYILSCILPSNYDLVDLPNLPNFTIVSYCKDLIETNEIDLIHKVNEFIVNYQVTWMIAYYALADTLFLAAQYSVFYLALVTKVIAIRLSKAKTAQAHTFHIENYLSSHHELNLYLKYLTDKQKRFLYKNILYLDNHAGRKDLFDTLIKVLFEDRDITLANYVYRQKASAGNTDINKTGLVLPITFIDPTNPIRNTATLNIPDIDYGFSKEALTNNSDYIPEIISLDSLRNKENTNNLTNSGEWLTDFHSVDTLLKSNITSKMLTKDLVTLMSDNAVYSDRTLTETIINYWGYYTAKKLANFIVPVLNKTTNVNNKLVNADAYKLLMTSIFLKAGYPLTYSNSGVPTNNYLPVINIEYVFNTLTNNIVSTMGSKLLNNSQKQTDAINNILTYIPRYLVISNIETFYKFILRTYLTDVNFWNYKNSLCEIDLNANINHVINTCHVNTTYNPGTTETIITFLNRIGFSNITDLWVNFVNWDNSKPYTKEQAYQALQSFLDDLITSILDTVTDNNYIKSHDSGNMQKAMANIFQTLSSYDTRIIESIELPASIKMSAQPIKYRSTGSITTSISLGTIFGSDYPIFMPPDINIYPPTPDPSLLGQAYLSFFL